MHPLGTQRRRRQRRTWKSIVPVRIDTKGSRRINKDRSVVSWLHPRSSFFCGGIRKTCYRANGINECERLLARERNIYTDRRRFLNIIPFACFLLTQNDNIGFVNELSTSSIVLPQCLRRRDDFQVITLFNTPTDLQSSRSRFAVNKDLGLGKETGRQGSLCRRLTNSKGGGGRSRNGKQADGREFHGGFKISFFFMRRAGVYSDRQTKMSTRRCE
jgi:hypothetical protein